MLNVSLEQGYGIVTMLLVAAAATLLTGTFYYRSFGMLGRRRWLLLVALRTAALLLIVMLLFRPVLSYYKEQTRRAALVFLLDTSASMSIADDASGVTRLNQARRQLDAWWERLGNDFELYLIPFAERARRLHDVKRQLPTLQPDGKATSLSLALVAAARLRDDDDRRVDAEAIILLSDGLHNTARNPRDLAVRMPSVVHTVGVGASLRNDPSYRDIQVTGIDCSARLMKNNLARITASVEGIGLAGRVVQVVLEDEGEPIEQIELTLDALEGAQPVTFELRPTVTGRHTYTVRIAPTAEERIAENNHRSAVALVIEPGIRVLYIEGTLRAEYGALVDRFLAKDPDLEFCALVQTRPNAFLRRSNIPDITIEAIPRDAETIGTFDVFILGDLDASYLRPQQQRLLVERIRNGAGLIMLGGYHSLGPGGYAGTPLGEILPLRLGTRDVGQVTEPFLPVLTPDGTHHPLFANIVDFFPTTTGGAVIEGLPPLNGCTRVEGARPSATVLARCDIGGDSMPMLAVQPVGKGRTAVFCGDTTRKWQQGPKALGQDSPFTRFWGQTVRWLAGRDTAVATGASLAASTEKSNYKPGEAIHIAAVVRNEQGQGVGGTEVVATLTGPTRRPIRLKLSPVAGPRGHYAATFEPELAGKYVIAVATTVDGQMLDAEKIVLEVGRPNLEFERVDCDEELLGQIASATGGRYVHITTADYLIDQIDRTQQKKRLRMTFPEYRWPLLLTVWFAFVGLLTTEWVLRKRFQLR